MRVDVTFLPPTAPEGEETTNGQKLADSVRAQMAEASGMPLHPSGAKVLRQELKAAAEKKAKEKEQEAVRKQALKESKSTPRGGAETMI